MAKELVSHPRRAGRSLRFVYLDEAGISNEPFTVVAGFILHVDSQYDDFVACLSSMARELFCNGVPKQWELYTTIDAVGERPFGSHLLVHGVSSLTLRHASASLLSQRYTVPLCRVAR